MTWNESVLDTASSPDLQELRTVTASHDAFLCKLMTTTPKTSINMIRTDTGFMLFYFRNRFLLTVICGQYITGWRSVVKWIFHGREVRVIYSLTTDRQPVMYYTTNHSLARVYFDSNKQNDEKASVPFRCCQFSAIT